MKPTPELVVERARRRLRSERRSGILCICLSLLFLVVLVGVGRVMLANGFDSLDASYASLRPEARAGGALAEHYQGMIQVGILSGIVIGGGLSIGIHLLAFGIQLLVGNRERRLLVELADRAGLGANSGSQGPP